MCKLFIIVHKFYTLRKPFKGNLAPVQFLKTPVSAIELLCDSKNKSTSNLEHLQYFDPNSIIVHPCKLFIIVH